VEVIVGGRRSKKPGMADGVVAHGKRKDRFPHETDGFMDCKPLGKVS